MPAKRKKWQVRYRTTSAVDNFGSEKATYEFVRSLARAYFADPDSMDPRVYVWVNKGDSRGWQRYDDLMLSEWGHLTPLAEKEA
jgi:hypothetical protein